MSYQLCMRDGYGQGSIIFSNADLAKVVSRGKQEINAVNVDNALTVEAKKQNWESFMIKLEVKEGSNYAITEEEGKDLGRDIFVYAGKDGRGVDQVFGVDNTMVPLSTISDDVIIKIYLGDLDRKPWYAALPSKTERGKEDLIDSLTHQVLQGKDIFYIRSI